MTSLAFEQAVVSYSGQLALSLPSLIIEQGERVALLGSSGAGKSTLLRLASGLTTPSAGRVLTLGSDLSILSTAASRVLRRRVGLISQGVDLIDPLSVAHNVSAGRIGSRSLVSQIRDLIRPGDLEEITAALESVGLGHKLRERASDLSGGERQRVAIARLRHQQPDLILADEPVSSLDPARGREVMTLLADLRGDQTLVVSLHDPLLALEYCQRIIGLRDGVIEFDQPAFEVGDDELKHLYDLAAS